MKLSVVIPVYNSEKTIGPLVETLQTALAEVSFEIVMVNDGSRDGSEKVCKQLAEHYANVRFISLRRNYGEFNAVICGLNWAYGDYCVMIDDDFQNPPEEILKLIKVAENDGNDVVYTYYSKKEHSVGRNLGSKLSTGSRVICLTNQKTFTCRVSS